jgi:DnaJ-class molecular chaperone
MALKDVAARAKKGAQDFDAMLYLITGKRTRHLVNRAWDLFGEDITKELERLFSGRKDTENFEYLYPDNPYRTLAIEPDAADCVVKGAFRGLAREYHPDTGTHPDEVKFQKVVEAYNAIMKARAEAKLKKA